MKKLGIDLGGTKIEAILLDSDGTIITRKRIPTLRDEGYEAIIDKIATLSKNILPQDDDYTIGICTPGSISSKTGRLRNSNTVCLINKPIVEDLESVFNQKVFMENDANCFAYAEAILGAGKNYNSVFGVIMGTGVGGGIVINRQIYHGRLHIAGEWGHTSLVSDGNDCYCGQTGCVETVLSGPALEASWFLKTGEESSLKNISDQFLLRDSMPPAAESWKNEFLNSFGHALGDVITLLDPDVIILGGGVSNIPFLYDEGLKRVYDHVFSDYVDTPILKNALGDSGGVFGAAFLPEMKK